MTAYSPMKFEDKDYPGQFLFCDVVPDIINWACVRVYVEEPGIFGSVRQITVHRTDALTDWTTYQSWSVATLTRRYTQAIDEYRIIRENSRERKKYSEPRKLTQGSMLRWLLFMVLAALCAWGVRSCTNAEEERIKNRPVLISQKVERFLLVHLDQPKHVYVTLKSVEDGRVYERIYVSKHCNKWRDNTINTEYNIKMNVMHDPKTKQTYPQFYDLYQTFCE